MICKNNVIFYAAPLQPQYSIHKTLSFRNLIFSRRSYKQDIKNFLSVNFGFVAGHMAAFNNVSIQF